MVTVVLLAIAWRIVVVAMLDHQAATIPQVNLSETSSAAALLDQFALNQIKLKTSAALVAASRAAETALRSTPLDVRALALAGLIAEQRGNRARADALMDIAANRTWRDPIVDMWVIVRSVQQRDFVSALARADALLRTNPELQPVALPMFLSMTALEPAFSAEVALLATSPPWRSGLLAELCDRLRDTSRLIALYEDLAKTAYPPTLDELRPYLSRLIKDGRYWDAYRDWATMGPPNPEKKLTALLFDGDFSKEPSGLPFDWVLTSVPGAQVAIVDAPEASGHALRVQFSGARVNFDNASQLLLLAPGDYRLSGSVMAEEFQSPRGLWWRIYCLGAGNETLAATPLVTGPMSWTTFGMNFHVPKTGCEAQWLILELPARTASEHEIAGEVWYRNLQIKTAQSAQTGPAASPKVLNK